MKKVQADVAAVAFAWCLSPGASTAGQPEAEREPPRRVSPGPGGTYQEVAWRFREMGPGRLLLSAARKKMLLKAPHGKPR